MIAILKYNAGNIRSVVNALHRLGVDPVLTDDADELRHADKVLFPGQGEAKTAMEYLREHNLDEVIKNLSQPVLGICIGQQLLCKHSEEGDTDCLGIFDVDVKRFQPTRHEDKVPAMGWQEIHPIHSIHNSEFIIHNYDRLFGGAANNIAGNTNNKCNQTSSPLGRLGEVSGRLGEVSPYVYFVHSYYVPLCKWTIAEADYILPYSAALHKDNFWTTQFHPEKSGKVGEQILKNFLAL